MRWAAFLMGLGCLAACAGTPANVRNQAATDFKCSAEKTLVVDEALGVFLIEGCGLQASYQCPEFGSRCRRIFVKKLVEDVKSSEMQDLAKSPASLH